jgi:hypothetical protein
MRFVRHLGFVLLLAGIMIYSCRKESFYEGHDAQLRFSNDTVKFDTIFSGIGSVTRRLMVYNPYNKSVKISSIQLIGNTSPFILNINGKQGNSASNIEMYPNDSMFIFIQIFVNTTGQNSPLLIDNQLEFNINGNVQHVDLEAFGQDVHLIRDEVIKTSTWEADKPYLIYGNATVDSLATLTIDKGVSVLFHKQANMRVKGTLNIDGDFKNPVIFNSDRLDKDYENVPGQWGGIMFLPGSKNNVFNWLVLKNGTSGIQIGSYNDFSKPDIELYNVIVQNMSYNCLLAIGARVKAASCLIANAATYTCGLLGGGEYDFYQCTIVNYYGLFYAIRDYSTPTLLITNYFADPLDPEKFMLNDLTSASFYNTIVYGGNTDELKLDRKPSSVFQYKFDHCLVKSKSYKDSSNNTTFGYMIYNQDPKFVASDTMKFELTKSSPAIDTGDIATGKLYPLDLKNNDRTVDKAPDLGAYEFVK